MNRPRTAWRRVVSGLTAMAVATLGLVAIAAPASAAEFTPAISVYLADGTTPYTDQPVADGDELVVKGTGFDPEANVGGRGVPIPADLPQGTYVVFGSFSPAWQPSTGAPSTARAVNQGSQVWALAESVLDQVPPQFQSIIRAAWTPIEADGSFTAKLTVSAPDAPPANGVWGVYTYGAGGVANAAQELSVAVNYGADDTTTPVKQTLKKAKPAIKGKAKVGKTLKVKVKKAKWTKGATLTIKWYADGTVIKKAKDSKTLKLTKKFKGKKITVQVTGKKKGFDKVTVTSKATKKVKKAPKK